MSSTLFAALANLLVLRLDIEFAVNIVFEAGIARVSSTRLKHWTSLMKVTTCFAASCKWMSGKIYELILIFILGRDVFVLSILLVLLSAASPIVRGMLIIRDKSYTIVCKEIPRPFGWPVIGN